MKPTQPAFSGMPTGKKFVCLKRLGKPSSEIQKLTCLLDTTRSAGGVLLPQKGIAQYSISDFRQNPFKGAFKHSVIQGTNRLLIQLPYVIPPTIVAYAVLQWARDDNHFRNTKEGQHKGYVP